MSAHDSTSTSLPARSRTSGRGVSSTATTLVLQVLILGAFVGLWQLAHAAEIGRPVVVQSPANVWHAMGQLIDDGTLWPNFWATLQPTLIALAAAVVVGTPIGLLLGILPRVDRVVGPFLSAINAMPRIALAPVFVIVFGIGISAKIALALSLAIFIMVASAQAGVNAADVESRRMMATLNATRAQTLRKVVLPAAVPSIVSGVRLCLIYSLLGVVASELIAARDGLGQLISSSAGVFDMATVYAVLVVLMVAAAVFNVLSSLVERRLLRWQAPTVR
ncbi:ABC transporter permease [Rhodococcus sp. WS4]|nr:ABC transporter permease [Rhodococcus sp. WS4]